MNVSTRKPARTSAPSETVAASAPVENEAFTPTPGTSHSPANIAAAFGSIADLLTSAYCTDEPHSYSGDSDRILRMAADVAESVMGLPPDAEQAQHVAFDIAALILASRRVPGDTESSERQALIASATPLLRWLTDDADVLQEKRLAAAPCREDGLNAVQLAQVLETVAGRTQTLRQILMILQTETNPVDQWENLVFINAAEIAAASIGAIADAAVGGTVIGDADHWNHGPNFARAGKAVHA